MISAVVVLSTLGLLGYLGLTYAIGRLVLTWLPGSPPPAVRTSAPLVGASLLALQLWFFGAVGIPWNALALLVPWVGLALLFRRSFARAVRGDARDLRHIASTRGFDTLEIVILAAGAVVALVYALNLVTQPVLGWDAIAMWLFKAKLYFTVQAVNLHPIAADIRRNLDYPPLFSLMVASIFTVIGHIDDIFGKSVNFVFFVSSVASFLAITWTLLGRRLALALSFLFAALPTLSNALFSYPYMGWADYPVGIFMLMSLIHLVDREQTGLPASSLSALFFAAMAALTKNEGLSFLVIVVVLMTVQNAVSLIRRREFVLADRWSLRLGAAIVMPVVGWQVYLRLNGIQAARLINNPSLGQLIPTLPHRLVAIIRGTVVRLASFHSDYPWIAGGFLLSVVLTVIRSSPMALTVAAVVTLQLLSYFAVYVITPFDIEYILSTTFDRLMLQMAPSIVLMLAVSLAAYTKDDPSVSPVVYAKQRPISTSAGLPSGS